MKIGVICSYKQHGGCAYSLHTEGTDEYTYLTGTVMTPVGLVSVYSQPNEAGRAVGRRAHSAFTMARNGRVYHLVEERAHTRRSLVRAAGKFARAVAAGRSTL